MSDLLKETFESIADRAQPVPGLAEDAMRRAARKRAGRLSAVVGVAAAGAMVVPFLLLGGGDRMRPEPSGAADLPANTPADQEVVRACLRDGSPVGRTGRQQPQYGGPSDHRLLVAARRGAETVAMVGGRQGFVLCSRGMRGNTEVPMFRPWLELDEKSLWSFNGDARLDAIGGLPNADDDGRPSADGLHHVVAGRVKPGVLKVTVTWNQNRTAEATIHNGFFIAAIDSKTEPRILKVDAYSPQGHWLYSWNAGRTEGIGEFNSADCAAPPSVQIRGLCQGLPDRP
jgi:hypothetical protein